MWLMDSFFYVSTDGGRTFGQTPMPHGDHHDLWIDPRNPRRMIEANDGGATVTFNGGGSWSTIYNQPTACFYHLAVDNQYPYRVYGTQQDSSAISVPSKSDDSAIPLSACYMTGTSESGHIAVRPDNPNVVYSGAIGSSAGGGGNLLRSDHALGDHIEIITVWPEESWGWAPKDQKYRFHWTYPILISPHDPDVLYCTGNLVFRSTNEGKSWEAISPDLTRNDPTKLEISGGPVTVQGVSGAETYCTIFAFTESPHERGVFWAGSDDGLIHISRDGGDSWENVTPPDLPEWTTVAFIEVSHHDPATAYVAAYRYKLDDYSPYLYKTGDYGKTWREITGGIGSEDFTRVIREDPERPGLLYAGTEFGLYVSFDDGEAWQKLQLNLPVAPLYDLAVKGDELVACTHGRSFWVLDDVTPLRQANERIAESSAHLFRPKDTHQDVEPAIFAPLPPIPGAKNYQVDAHGGTAFYVRQRADGSQYRSHVDAGDNPPRGVSVFYYLNDEPEGEVTLTFADSGGREIASYTSGEEPSDDRHSRPGAGTGQHVPVAQGMNRFVWDMRYPGPKTLPNDSSLNVFYANDQGPEAPPGTYQVWLAVGGQVYDQSFEILKDPRVFRGPGRARGPLRHADADPRQAHRHQRRHNPSPEHLPADGGVGEARRGPLRRHRRRRPGPAGEAVRRRNRADSDEDQDQGRLHELSVSAQLQAARRRQRGDQRHRNAHRAVGRSARRILRARGRPPGTAARGHRQRPRGIRRPAVRAGPAADSADFLAPLRPIPFRAQSRNLMRERHSPFRPALPSSFRLPSSRHSGRRAGTQGRGIAAGKAR